MIVRPEGKHFLLITQPDHARLAGDIAVARQVDGVCTTPRRSSLLLAAREHDNGWIEPDAAPDVDPATGRPYDFLSAPTAIKQAVWPRGVSRLEPVDPLAAAFIAQHALTVLKDYQSQSEWQSFFGHVTALRDALLQRCNICTPVAREVFMREYQVIYLCDFLSLAFCNGWMQRFEASGCRFRLERDDLWISPDPFGGQSLRLSVPARRIPNRPYASAADLQQALGAAESLTLRGTAIGVEKLETA